MKITIRIILLLAILFSILYIPAAFAGFYSLTGNPGGWQGGVSDQSTLVWFAILTLGYGYLSIQTFFALLGLFFGFRKRIAAFWLLLLPGMFGMLLGLIWLLLLMMYDVEWPSSWLVAVTLIVPPLIAYFSGRFVRKSIPKKGSRHNSENQIKKPIT